MRQTLHLLIVGHDGRLALAAWQGVRWMLPILDVAERVRAAPAVLEWLVVHGMVGEVAGQWLGRMHPNGETIDWIVVARVSPVEPKASPQRLRWTPLHRLRASAALVDYQGWAVAAISPAGDAPVTHGPFGDIKWLEEVRAWVGSVLCLGDRSIAVVPHRVSAYDLVVECHTARGRFFLKGLSKDRAIEATITMRMHELAPQSFPRTVASATRADGSLWWLMEACPGQTLAENLTTALSADVAAAHARVQQRVGADEMVHSLLPALDLSELERWARDLLEEGGESSAVERCALAIREAWECIDRTHVAWSWVACDLDPSNAIMHGRDVRFIDLDDSVVGPAPLAIATLTRRIRRVAPDSVGNLLHSYETAWQPALVIDESWSKFELISRVLECHLGWQRIRLKSERGEVQGLLDHARRLVATKVINACTKSGADS